MKAFVLGFVFNYSDEVLLMTKDHPPLQKDRLNGVGGHINANGAGVYESPEEAMARESAEELKTEVPITWTKVGVFGSNVASANPWKVYVFVSRFRLPIEANEKEPVAWYSLYRLPDNCMYNLSYLVPLCHQALMWLPRRRTLFFDILED